MRTCGRERPAELYEFSHRILGFTGKGSNPTTDKPKEIDLEEGVRKTLEVLFYDTDGQIGLEFGQTEERRLFLKPFNYLDQTAGTSYPLLLRRTHNHTL